MFTSKIHLQSFSDNKRVEDYLTCVSIDYCLLSCKRSSGTRRVRKPVCYHRVCLFKVNPFATAIISSLLNGQEPLISFLEAAVHGNLNYIPTLPTY